MSLEVANENADIGRDVETEICSTVYPELERVTSDAGEPDWCDAFAVDPIGSIVPAGTPGEIKSCREWIVDGSSRRRGRWWFRKEPSRKLAIANGIVILVVRDDADSILRRSIVRASTVWALLEERWTPTGDRHYAAASAQLPWSAVYRSLDRPSGGEA